MEKFILKNWLIWSWELASLKYVGQAGWLKTRARVEVAVGSKIHREGFCCGLKEEVYILLRETSLFAIKAFNWLKPTHIIESNLLYLKFTDCKC